MYNYKGDANASDTDYQAEFPSIRDKVSPEEWKARVNLAACYRLVDSYGMSDLIYNHITVRVPGTEHLLINLYGLTYKEITASSLAKIDLKGNVISKPETEYGINAAGYVIHGAVHEARPDVDCVIHTHSRAGMAVSAMKCGLLPITQHSMRFSGHIGYHDFEGPALGMDERVRLVANLGKHNALILRSHGIVSCGASIAEAFNLLYQLEMSCRAQVDAMAAGGDGLITPDQTVIDKTCQVFNGSLRRYGILEWPAMLRRVEAESRNSPYPHYAS
jgi:ribulose-5-phosphate 4-epimerase/fuculose-1-phosphate aldolase